MKTDTPSWSLYRSIHELPLARWIDLSVDWYLKALAKHGDPPELELRVAEQEIRIQYSDAAGDSQYRLYINLVKEISRLEITLHQIESLIATMRQAYHPLFAKELNGLMNMNLRFDPTRPAEYDKNLDRIYNRSRSYKVSIGMKTLQVKQMEKRYSGDQEKPTREYYAGTLIALSDEAGYPLSDQITTWEFLERIRRFNKKYEPKLKPKRHG